MADRVPSIVARNAKGEDVTAAALRGEEEYYAKSIDCINDTETLHHLILLTTNRGFGVQYPDFNNWEEGLDELIEEMESSPHRQNVMGISDQRIILISDNSYNSEKHCRSIPHSTIESIHGSAGTNNYTLIILTGEEYYTINTAKSHRISDFREAMAYLSTCIEE